MSHACNVKYKAGSGKASANYQQQLDMLIGQTESEVMSRLKKKHKNVKDLEIIIEKIDWQR